MEADPQYTVTVDLAAQKLVLPDGRAVEFPVDAFSKHCLLEGVDELGYIQKHEAEIAAYEARRAGYGEHSHSGLVLLWRHAGRYARLDSEYLHTSYDPDCDYVDGVIEERNLGETSHAALQALITLHLMQQRRTAGILRERVLVTKDGRVRLDLDAIEQDLRA